MPIATAANLVDALQRGRLLEPAQLDELAQVVMPRFADPKELAKELVRRGWLTAFQVNQLVRGQDLVLDQYVLVEPLGEGGMGQVFKARHRKLGRVVALKVIRKERLSALGSAKRFRREAEASARLDHPNIVRVYDAGEKAGVHFLAMELIEGTDLAKLVKTGGPLPATQACDFIRQAAGGLAHAHERGLIHRDIKPSNLMVTTDGIVKVLDMGLARLEQSSNDATSSLTVTGAVVGTPDYIAPEQALSAKKADIRSDIYSLGCTLYHLLTGRPPFSGDSFTEKLLKHQLEEAPPVEGLRAELPPGLPEVVRRMMARSPAQRFQTPVEVAQALAPFTTADLLSAQATDTRRDLHTAKHGNGHEAAAPTRRTRRVQVLAGGLLALVLLASGGVYLAVSSQRPAVGQKGPSTALGTKPSPVLADRPAMVLHCGRSDGWSPWETLMPGYGAQLVEGSVSVGPRREAAWTDSTKIRFSVQVPRETPGGELHLFFLDDIRQRCSVSVHFQDKQVGGSEKADPSGRWLKLSVQSSAIKDGRIGVSVENLTKEAKLLLTRLQFYPLVSPNAPPPSGPALVVRCGRGASLDGKRGNEEEVVAPGYSCSMRNGLYSHAWVGSVAWPHCWGSTRELSFTIRVPKGTAGKLKMHFLDGDNQERKQEVWIGNKKQWEIEKFSDPGVVRIYDITAAETARVGEIEVVLKSLVRGKNAVISSIEFTPEPK